MSSKRVLVTVGTTKFPELINKLADIEVIDALVQLGFKFIQVQAGEDFASSNLKTPQDCSVIDKDKSKLLYIENKITIQYDPYFENFDEKIQESDLVISHAGAGTCLEVLRKHKPLIVVVNESLMDNHQVELAKQLEEDGYLYFCTCNTLVDALRKDFSKLKHYNLPNPDVFANYLDKCVGFMQKTC